MNGLLGGAMPQQMQQGGGLLGGGAMPQQAQGGGNELKYAQALSQNPTPELAMQIVQALKKEGDPSGDELEQILQQIGDNPQQIKQLADAVIQELSGGNQENA